MYDRFATKNPFIGNGFYDDKVKLRPNRQKRFASLSFFSSKTTRK